MSTGSSQRIVRGYKSKSVTVSDPNTVEEVYDFGAGIVVGILSVVEKVVDRVVSAKCVDCPRRSQ